ncbi:MAG: nucleoside phosphorylase [Deltaproteobacteria bacterium]|nr:nucleoside phosphorylase [Deltaproteobacteria bacterium]
MQRETHSQGIIHPVKGKRDPTLGPVVLMVMLPQELKRLVRLSGAIEIQFSDSPLYRLYRAESETPASAVALAGPFIGAPHAVMGLEKLIVMGARQIWVLGWCGSLQPDLNIGDLVIPVRAISEEGTSQHYPLAGEEPSADPGLNRMLAGAVVHKGREAVEGDIWTTDAIYRETPEKVSRFQKLGVLAVDMELSALLTVAAYRSSSLTALMVVSDELSDLKWKPGFSEPRLRESTRLAGDLLFDLSKTSADRYPLK